MTCPVDPALEVVQAAVGGLLTAFDPGQECPPTGGGTETVRIFAGDAPPLAAWDAHVSSKGGKGCAEPFVWVRGMRRYRSRQFPEPSIAMGCVLQKVVAVEVGVGRCAVVDQTPKWQDYADEAARSFDDAWRIEIALCTAMGLLQDDDSERAVGTDIVNPYGPEGGIVAWTGTLYASY